MSLFEHQDMCTLHKIIQGGRSAALAKIKIIVPELKPRECVHHGQQEGNVLVDHMGLLVEIQGMVFLRQGLK